MNDRLKTDSVPVNSFALERRRVRASFDRAAERYDSAAGLQRRAADELPAARAPSRIDARLRAANPDELRQPVSARACSRTSLRTTSTRSRFLMPAAAPGTAQHC